MLVDTTRVSATEWYRHDTAGIVEKEEVARSYVFSSGLRRSTDGSLRQSFNAVLVLVNVHNGHTGHLANPSLQVAVACSHNVASMLLDAVNKAIVRIHLVPDTRQSLEALIFGNLQRNTVLGPELLELRDDAVRNAGCALGI